MGLYEAARAEVNKNRGKEGQAERQKANSLEMVGIGRQRVLQIFEKTSHS
jgi:hypothetical protein